MKSVFGFFVLLCCVLHSLTGATTLETSLRREAHNPELRRLFVKFAKAAKALFFIPGPFEPEDTVTPFQVIANETTQAVNATSTAFWDPFFENVISRKIDQQIASVESKTEVLKAKDDLKIAIAKIPFEAFWGPNSFEVVPLPDEFELGVS